MKKEQVRHSREQLVDEQIAKWNRLRTKPRREILHVTEVITISREPGTFGTTIARNLAATMKMDFLSAELIKKVADSAQMSETVVASLDEKGIALIEDWLKMLFDTQHLWPDKYLKHLTKVISAIGIHGNAVIVGRGANYILPPQETFRVRLIAPLQSRIANAAKGRALSHDAAEKYVIQTAANRKAFVEKYFHADINDTARYDTVIDTSRLGIEGAVETIKCAFNSFRKCKAQQRSA